MHGWINHPNQCVNDGVNRWVNQFVNQSNHQESISLTNRTHHSTFFLKTVGGFRSHCGDLPGDFRCACPGTTGFFKEVFLDSLSWQLQNGTWYSPWFPACLKTKDTVAQNLRQSHLPSPTTLLASCHLLKWLKTCCLSLLHHKQVGMPRLILSPSEGWSAAAAALGNKSWLAFVCNALSHP
jgi:hypothetical protein